MPSPDTSSRPYEVERDRFGVYYSGPLEVGECIRVVSVDALLTEDVRDAAANAIADEFEEMSGGVRMALGKRDILAEAALRAAIAVATSRTHHGGTPE